MTSGGPAAGHLGRNRFPHLPNDFAFGVSSSALGIEGGAAIDGRTASIWDAVAAGPGRTADGSTGAVAVDHYHRYPEDLALLAELGVDAYRFSISWSRIQPGGTGPSNAEGLDFYDRLVDGLLAIDIEPWATLYHSDLPVDAMMRGGWLDRDTASAMADFAALASDRIGDRVARWITMADPVIHMGYGHALGVDAPGLTLLADAIMVTHHLLLAHGLAREVFSETTDAPIGIANRHTAVTPAGSSAPDRVAAAIYDAYHNGQFADPILLGRYPRLLRPLLDRHPGLIKDGDLKLISAPLDFYGVNYFHPTAVTASPDNATIPFDLSQFNELAVTENDWPIHPRSLGAVLHGLTDRYPNLPPLVVTENGAAFSDVESPSTGDATSTPQDSGRINYVASHIAAIDQAIAEGVDVRGYFHRGLTDAWEGSEGFTRQFGLVRVSEDSLSRTPRASFAFFQKVITEHRRRRTSEPGAHHASASVLTDSPPAPPY